MPNIRWIAPADIGDDLMVCRLFGGVNVFVSYLRPDILMRVRSGTVIKFEALAFYRRAKGIRASRLTEALIRIEEPKGKDGIRRFVDFFRTEMRQEGETVVRKRIVELPIDIDLLVMNQKFTVAELPAKQVVPDITFDVPAQLEREGIIEIDIIDELLFGISGRS